MFVKLTIIWEDRFPKGKQAKITTECVRGMKPQDVARKDNRGPP